MNLIFGKYQLNIHQFTDSGHVKNSNKLVQTRFRLVFGFGSTKIRWILAHVGGTENLKVSNFFDQPTLINREKIISKAMTQSYFQLMGSDLKHVWFQQKSKTQKFINAFKKTALKKPATKLKNKRNKKPN